MWSGLTHMIHLHVCSFTLIYAGPRWWGLDTSKQFGPRSHTRDIRPIWTQIIWQRTKLERPSMGSFYIVVHEVCLVSMQCLVGVYTVHRCPETNEIISRMSTYTESRRDREFTSFQCAFKKTFLARCEGCRTWSDVGLRPDFVLLCDIRKICRWRCCDWTVYINPLGCTGMGLQQNMDELA